ncbi:hypothetical protein ACLOJK_034489 [Asimina triloba]
MQIELVTIQNLNLRPVAKVSGGGASHLSPVGQTETQRSSWGSGVLSHVSSPTRRPKENVPITSSLSTKEEVLSLLDSLLIRFVEYFWGQAGGDVTGKPGVSVGVESYIVEEMIEAHPILLIIPLLEPLAPISAPTLLMGCPQLNEPDTNGANEDNQPTTTLWVVTHATMPFQRGTVSPSESMRHNRKPRMAPPTYMDRKNHTGRCGKITARRPLLDHVLFTMSWGMTFLQEREHAKGPPSQVGGRSKITQEASGVLSPLRPMRLSTRQHLCDAHDARMRPSLQS